MSIFVAALTPPGDDRAEFRKAVAVYQGYVVPRCAPAVTRAYKAARAERDRAFVRSLGGTVLMGDYRDTLARVAEEQAGVQVMCAAPEDIDRAQAFADGDRQFARMVALRDRLMRRKG